MGELQEKQSIVEIMKLIEIISEASVKIYNLDLKKLVAEIEDLSGDEKKALLVEISKKLLAAALIIVSSK